MVGPEALMGSAMDTARQMLAKSPLGLRLTKESLNMNLNASSLKAAIELENRTQSICCTMPEFVSAVEAFRKVKT
jgi:enoyl-CoA hydratase